MAAAGSDSHEESNMEIWRRVVGYENSYHISNHGRVKSLHKVNPRNGRVWPETILKLIVHTNRYHVCWLYEKCEKRKFFVHRLVAIAFIENPEAKDYVNHKDKNRTHNHIDNLEWLTHQENMDHRDGRTPINNDEPF